MGAPRGPAMPDRVRGAALFADISGFTPLTEALADELGAAARRRGADRQHLDRVFHASSTSCESYGGNVIYFSGDAITCWIDGDDGTRAAACALAMQDAMSGGDVVTPAGTRVSAGMKAAVAVGPARRFIVGDPDDPADRRARRAS